MSTNAILAALYIELGLFILAIMWPIAARMFSNRPVRVEPVSAEQRDLVVSRLTTTN